MSNCKCSLLEYRHDWMLHLSNLLTSLLVLGISLQSLLFFLCIKITNYKYTQFYFILYIILFCFFSYNILLTINHKMISYRNTERGHPYILPDVTEKTFSNSSSIKLSVRGLEMLFIRLRKFSSIPRFLLYIFIMKVNGFCQIWFLLHLLR